MQSKQTQSSIRVTILSLLASNALATFSPNKPYKCDTTGINWLYIIIGASVFNFLDGQLRLMSDDTVATSWFPGIFNCVLVRRGIQDSSNKELHALYKNFEIIQQESCF